MTTGTNPGEIAVRMDRVSRFFYTPDFMRALTRVNLAVRRGEVFGLLGPAGAGKSTALRILAGRLLPSEGKARVFGYSPWRRAAKSRVGYLPLETGRSRGSIFERATAVLGGLFTRRSGEGNTTPEATRGGIHRSLLLSRFLLRNPQLLLLDEPFLGLDPAACEEMKSLIRTQAQRGKTVILTGSSLHYASDVCDRMALLHEGKIDAMGTLEELLDVNDSFRFMSLLLPRETAERVLQLLRQDLGASLRAKAEPSDASRARAEEAAGESVAVPPCNKAEANRVLDPLLKAPPPNLSATPSNGASSQPDHDMLAALTKPPPDSPQSVKEKGE